MMRTLIADVRHVLRLISSQRGFAAVVILTIALGVGANAALFSVINAVLVRRLPYPNSDRLVALHETERGETAPLEVSYPNFLEWQRGLRGIEHMAARSHDRYLLRMGDRRHRIESARVSWNYFNVLGVAPIRGRNFLAEDDLPDAAPVIMISETLWRGVFGADPAIVGRSVIINRQPVTIVGVVSADFTGVTDGGLLDETQLWAPLGHFGDPRFMANRAGAFIAPVLARLRPGVSIEQVRGELNSLMAELARRFPDSNANRGAMVVSLSDQFFGDVRSILLVLLGAV